MRTNSVKKASIIGLVISSCFLINAQDNKAEAVEITLEQAIQIALNENPSVKIAEQEIQKKKYAKKSMQSSLYPQIDATGQYRQLDQAKGSITGGLNATLPVIAPALWKNLQLSGLDIELAVENARSSKINMINAVRKAYYGVLLAKDVLQVFRQSYDNAVLSYNDINNKHQQGLASEFDLIRADVNAKNIKPNLIQAQNAYNIACLSLKALMGIDIDQEIVINGSLKDYETSLYSEIVTANTLLDLASNSDLKQFDLRNKQLQKLLKLYRVQYLPTIAVTENYTNMMNMYMPTSANWNLISSIVLSIPVFDGLKKYNDIRQTKINLKQMQWQREDIVRNLKLAIDHNINNMANYAEQVFSTKDVVIQAQKGYEISQKLYDTGMGTLLDLNNAQLGLTQASLAFTQAIYNFLISKADLDKTLGTDINDK